MRNALLDNAHVNAKGKVKLELYDEKGEVFFTRVKKNLVVLTANEIIGNSMSDPAKSTRATKTDAGASSSTANSSGSFTFPLSVVREQNTVYEVDPGVSNTLKTFTLPHGLVQSISKLTVGGTVLVQDKDFFLSDEDKGTLLFVVAPTALIHVEYRFVLNPYVEVISGTESVSVNGVAFTRGTAPSDAGQNYTIDSKLGEIYFETAKTNVSVSYTFKVPYSLAFMGVGDKPAGHPDYTPVSFGDADKIKTSMESEYVGSRELIQYPCVVGVGDPEIDIFPDQAIEFTAVTNNVTIVDSNADGTPDSTYTVPTGGIKILQLTKVHNSTSGVDYVVGTDVKLVDPVAGSIQFEPSAVIAINDVVNVSYQEQANNNYLNYTLTNAPIMKLVSVTHADDAGNVTGYNVVNNGLTLNSGDVWVLNANAGIVQFKPSPTGIAGQPVPPGPEVPGQLTFTYMVNSGTTVQYIADFPKGVPGPVLTPTSQTFSVTAGATTYTMDHPIAKDSSGNFIVSISKNGVALTLGTDYTVATDGSSVTFTVATTSTDSIIANYSFMQDTHMIYQVAMFTDQKDGSMFNISGIGPVTKDANTGMRITWSVTY